MSEAWGSRFGVQGFLDKAYANSALASGIILKV